jgi:regulator of PEP synthase PpsR (kinase-PPPase family)
MSDRDRAYLVRRWKDELRAAEHAGCEEAVARHHRLASGYARRIAAIDAACARPWERTA